MLHLSPHSPRLIIDGVEVKSFISGSFSDSGSNQLQSLSATFSDPDLEDAALFGKKVELFLNNGSEDGAPLFRGYIKQTNASDSSISINALDPRMLLTAAASVPIVIDDKNNYDGYTIVQFLSDYIDNEINTDEILITAEYLHEMDRPVFMTGQRGVTNPYGTVQSLIETKIDDETSVDRTDTNAVFDYSLDVIHGGRNSGVTIRKRRALDGNADMYFKYGDGIITLSYTERAPPSFALGTVEGEGGDQVIFDYGNAPLGAVGYSGKAKAKGESRGELRENLIPHLILQQQFTKEIEITCSKGYSLGIGNIIHIDVPKLNLYGNYAVTSKRISVGNSMTCSITCNNKPIKLSDYLN